MFPSRKRQELIVTAGIPDSDRVYAYMFDRKRNKSN